MTNRLTLPLVRVSDDIPDATVPRATIGEAADLPADRAVLGAAARALAKRFRPERLPTLPVEVEIEVVAGTAVESYHYLVNVGEVVLDAQPAPDADIRVTLQKAADFVLMDNGVSLMTIVTSGRAGLTGDYETILSLFGQAEYPAQEGRRSFADLCALLRECMVARPREVVKLVDTFSRKDFAREFVYLFADAATLSGLPEELPPATIKVGIGGVEYLCKVSPRGCSVTPMTMGTPFEATIDIPKVESLIDRLLGRVGDMDAILSRRMLVSGPAVDDLMPLFERISGGLTVFTSLEEPNEWTFPS